VTRLRRAIEVEEIEAIHPIAGSRRDAIVGLGAVVVVIVASVGMEQSAATLGSQARVPDLAIGALLLAAVTSLPNAVAAIYLATRHRGLAAMSEAFHSNAFNVIIGLLMPAVLTGFGVSGGGFLIATWYLGLTVAAVVLALVGRGLGRLGGIVIVGGYVAFIVTVIAL
jgi:Ca2+/Na+ antiporter